MRCLLLFPVAGVVAASLLLFAGRACGPEGVLQTMRDDVRNGTPSSSSPAKKDSSDNQNSPSNNSSNSSSGGDGSEATAALVGLGMVATAPVWIPMALIDNHPFQMNCLPDYPYNASLGDLLNRAPKIWSLRFDAEYADNFDNLDRFGGHLLLETASRFGLEAAASQFEEGLSDNRRDRLCLGVANLVYRFAQADWAEFRAGLGANWLADKQDSNFGFNFTYAADFFPCKPWVISSAIDCGTLGRTGLFRFRATAGVVFHGVEAYAGYEYLDVGRADVNALVTGLRFWF